MPLLRGQTFSQSRNISNPLLQETAATLYELWALALRKADSNQMTDKWDLRFLNLAKEVATWSKDPSTKVGCVIVRPDLTIAGVGFNGFPRGMCDHKELYEERKVKLARTIHAEVNAVLNSRGPVEDCTAYVTHPPCTGCAAVLIQSGVSRVVCNKPSEDLLSRWGEQLEQTKGFFAEVEIEYEEV
jgi:dCMP deaminase